MSFVTHALRASGKQPGKQKALYDAGRGSTMGFPICALKHAQERRGGTPQRSEKRLFDMVLPSEAAEIALNYAFCCFPPASPAFRSGAGKQKTPRRASRNFLNLLGETGAGEGIRTLDPNLGKVVLYP